MNMVSALGREVSTRWQITGLVQALVSRSACNVIATWLRDDRFLDAGGEPSMLLMSGDDGPKFVELVHGVDVHLDADGVLSELTRLGLVEKVNTGWVMLRRSAYCPASAGSIERARSERAAQGMLFRRYTDVDPEK